jgi:hypothetical protein
MYEHWHEYRKAAYDLILESEGLTATYLDNEVEAYIVHLFATNFNRTDIGEIPVAIKMLTAMQHQISKNYQPIGDECLLINSFPFRRGKWPSDRYYRDMGQIAYSMANLSKMEKNFDSASLVLHTVFKKIG